MLLRPIKLRYILLCGGLAIIWAVNIGFKISIARGPSGVIAQKAAMERHEQLQAELAQLQTERMKLENLTKRLNESYLDLDLLDERARLILGYARANEKIILSDEGKTAVQTNPIFPPR